MLDFIYYPVSWILWVWHRVFGAVLGPDNGFAWALSVVFLVFTLRILLYKPFVKQVRTTRQMQELQPQIKALQKKYGKDKQRMAVEMQKLQKEHGFNPIMGCLPVLAQAPVFIGLFHVLRSFNRTGTGFGQLGLTPAEIGFGRHLPSRHSAGVGFDLVPVASLDAIGRARPTAAFNEAFGDSDHPAVYIYTAETVEAGSRFHARMFAPGMGISEDPATGSAAAAFAGALMQFEKLGDGTHDFVIEQGYEMGRPSLIALQMVIEQGALASAEIGGDAVIVAEGTLYA